MSSILRIIVISLLLVTLVSCGKLSREAKDIAGSYTIPELSQEMPVMELNRDATCIIRAIKPGVLVYSVAGKWNVEGDSLVMDLDPVTLTIEQGDASLVGEIPTKAARKVAGHTDVSLELEYDNIRYYYKKIK